MFDIFLPTGKYNSFSYLRAMCWILLVWYSLQFFSFDINTAVMDAFIHGPNLIFHEAGHVIFSLFGDFIMILGGSLGQCLMPLIVAFVFLFKEFDPFASSIGLWWLGQNMTDVALYISDASARSLPLIGGMSEDAHDWGNLLTMTDLLAYDHFFGIIIHYIGMGIMLLSLVWGGYILYYTYMNSRRVNL